MSGENNPAQSTPGRTYWIAAAIALIWFALGSANFIFQLSPGAIENYPPAEQAMITSRPSWATLGFAVSVFSGLAGAVAMLFRRIIAEKLLLVSLLGTMMATAYPILQGMVAGFFLLFMTMVLPLIFGIWFFWTANSAKEKGWLR